MDKSKGTNYRIAEDFFVEGKPALGWIGETIKFRVISRGFVALRTAQIEVKVQNEFGCELDVDLSEKYHDTYDIMTKPTSIGTHLISVKICGQHISGSPFPLKVIDKNHYLKITKPSMKFGIKGSGKGQLKYPFGVSTDSKGNIYVSEFLNRRVQVFNYMGDSLRFFGNRPEGTLVNPCGILVDKNENVVVIDNSQHCVQIFGLNGEHCLTVGHFGRGEVQFHHPRYIAQHPNGNFYITDSINDRICVFDENWNYLQSFGSQGSLKGMFDCPRGIAIDSTGRIVVSEYNSHRIQIFDANGIFIQEFGCEGKGDGKFKYPQGVCIDKNDNIVVSDQLNNRLQMFDNQGNFIHKINDLEFPACACFDKNGSLIVAHSNEILVYGTQSRSGKDTLGKLFSNFKRQSVIS